MKPIHLLIFSLILATTTACTKSTYEIISDGTVIVNAILTNDNVQTVRLMYYSSTETCHLPVDDAEVSITKMYSNGKEEEFRFKKMEAGTWSGKLKPSPGEIFKLTVRVPDKQIITATTTYPDTLQRQQYDRLAEYDGLTGKILIMAIKKSSVPCWIYGADFNPAENIWFPSSGITYNIYNHSSDTHNTPSQYLRCELQAIIPDYTIPFIAFYEGENRIYLSQNGYIPEFPRINLEGRKYYSSDPKYPLGYALHPKSHLIIEAVNEDYDKFLLDEYDSFSDKVRESPESLDYPWKYLGTYSNIENGKGIFGASYKLKVRMSDAQDVSDMDIWTKYQIELPY